MYYIYTCTYIYIIYVHACIQIYTYTHTHCLQHLNNASSLQNLSVFCFPPEMHPLYTNIHKHKTMKLVTCIYKNIYSHTHISISSFIHVHIYIHTFHNLCINEYVLREREKETETGGRWEREREGGGERNISKKWFGERGHTINSSKSISVFPSLSARAKMPSICKQLCMRVYVHMRVLNIGVIFINEKLKCTIYVCVYIYIHIHMYISNVCICLYLWTYIYI